jgi:hypothetical protein
LDTEEQAAQPVRRPRKAPAKTGATKREAKAPVKKVGGGAAKTAPVKRAVRQAPKKGGRLNAAELGLPTDAGEIANYITAYKGVGPKSVQSLIETFGAGRVFDALETKPDAVRDLMGAARADRLLQAWSEDIASRRGGSARPGREPAAERARAAARPAAGGAGRAQTAAEPAEGDAEPDEAAAGTARKGRTRRGGRRARKGQTAGK